MRTATKIVQILQDNGFVAYFAGGFVRDMILGIESNDIDIATSAKPEQVERLFESTVPIGKQFGIILVNFEGKSFEVATFRCEGKYLDKRRPQEVTFTNEKEDALRRDFTINGLFYDPIKNKIIDYVGGQEDIKKKTVRFILNPRDRINEDNLRLIRAIRFKITLSFQYDKQTFEAVRELAHLIKNVSAERIRDELNKIMSSENRHLGLVELSESSLLKMIIPEVEQLKGVPQPFEYHHEGDVFTHTYLALKSLGKIKSSHLAWAVLLHDIAKPETLIIENDRIIFHDHAKISAEVAEKILRRLKFPKYEIYEICWLIANHMRIGDIDKMRPAKKLEFLTDVKFADLIRLTQADSKGTYPVNLSLVKKMSEQHAKALIYKTEKEDLFKNKLISGDDLIKLGLQRGPRFREILDDVNDKIVEQVIKTSQEALDYIKKKYL